MGSGFVDGSYLNQNTTPRRGSTFGNYGSKLYPQKIQALAAHSECRTVHVVWDVYKDLSLKAEERQRRGRGNRRKVTSQNKVPSSWPLFLRDTRNKPDLNLFLADSLCSSLPALKLIVTKGELALSNYDCDLTSLSPCNHEEADTRIFLHMKHMVLLGHKSILK